MTISILALKGKLNGKILLLLFFFVGYSTFVAFHDEVRYFHFGVSLVNYSDSDNDKSFLAAVKLPFELTVHPRYLYSLYFVRF